MSDARRSLNERERALRRKVMGVLSTFGYATEHAYKMETADGYWRTPHTTPGFPDVFAIREPRILAIECKVANRQPTPEQRAWLTMFATIPCARAWVVRDTDDWPMIAGWIRAPKEAPHAYGFDPVQDPLVVLGNTRRDSRNHPRHADASSVT